MILDCELYGADESGISTSPELEASSSLSKDGYQRQDPLDFQPDEESQNHGEQTLSDAASSRDRWIENMWNKLIWSRVLKDPFHVFNMFYISVSHGLCIDFAYGLRDAVFIYERESKACIIAWGSTLNPPLSWYDLVRKFGWKWIHHRCKRVIPPPEELYPLVEQVFRTYGPLKDSKTGQPLFNAAAWAVAKNILDLISKGYLSDPPGVALYRVQKIDKKHGGLPIYQCLRGTNWTEGGVHTHLRARLPTSGASIEHVQASLDDFILIHNLKVRQIY